VIKLLQGDCLEVMKGLADNSVDSIVTDPPAGISFMGAAWDHHKGGRDEWIIWMQSVAAECNRLLKPGGHALVWAIPRTSHWTATAWENAGFEVRDIITHCFGSGFPKSQNISKMLDKMAGAERFIVGKNKFSHLNGKANKNCYGIASRPDETAPATEAAKQWDGWGSSLKPAAENWLLLRKPLGEKTIAANVLKYGTGGINIDGCRIETKDSTVRVSNAGTNGEGYGMGKYAHINGGNNGRWPANLILSYPEDEYDSEGALLPNPGKEEVLALFPTSKPRLDLRDSCESGDTAIWGNDGNKTVTKRPQDNGGSAARFFYCAKASKRDRDEGCENLEAIHRVNGNKWTDQDYRVTRGERPQSAESGPRKNTHATVKPLALMKYLCRLITHPCGVILDPFLGSGSTGKAAVIEGFSFIGIELEEDYFAIAKARIAAAGGNLPEELDESEDWA